MKTLYIFIEGPNDRRFFERIISPNLLTYFNFIHYYEYACQTYDKVNRFIRSLQSMSIPYLFVGDLDEHVCVTEKKNKLSTKYPICESNFIQIVGVEIESWYFSGLQEQDLLALKIHSIRDANSITKEKFQRSLPEHSITQDMMIKMLDVYDVNYACRKNKTLNYFFTKKLPLILNRGIY